MTLAAPGEGFYPQQVAIEAYGNGGFRFADMSHRGSLLCLPTGMHRWDVAAASEVTLETLGPVVEAADSFDVLMIGLGHEILALEPAIRAAFRERQVIVEASGTGSAVRTYSIRLAEQRAVAAALIAVENIRP